VEISVLGLVIICGQCLWHREM